MPSCYHEGRHHLLGQHPIVDRLKSTTCMLSNTLTTNEIKDASAAEVEFQRLDTDGRTTEYAKVGEAPNLPHRLRVNHQEVGTGQDQRRRSRVGFVKNIAGVSGTTRQIKFDIVGDIPVGDIANTTEAKNVLAELLSFCATTGAGTTVLFDCTGTGADVLINGTL